MAGKKGKYYRGKRRRFQPSDRDRAVERDHLADGHGRSVDSFAFDSSGNDTGLRESDFI